VVQNPDWSSKHPFRHHGFKKSLSKKQLLTLKPRWFLTLVPKTLKSNFSPSIRSFLKGCQGLVLRTINAAPTSKSKLSFAMVVHDVEIGIALILFQFCIIPTYDTDVLYQRMIPLHYTP
jgi:hypothetical protein